MQTFTTIDEVKLPEFVMGETAITLDNGTWVPCVIQNATIFRLGRRKQWSWRYHVTIRGVHVCRCGHNNELRHCDEVTS